MDPFFFASIKVRKPNVLRADQLNGNRCLLLQETQIPADPGQEQLKPGAGISVANRADLPMPGV